MSLGAQFDTAGAEIFAAFAVPVRYEPVTGPVIDPLLAVFGQEAAPTFDGPGATTRHSHWRVRRSAVTNPKRGDVIVASAVRWAVIDITRHDDVAEWELAVEVTT